MTGLSDFPPVDSLSLAALDVRHVERDWSEGYGETWTYVEAPDCPECGSDCTWDDERHGWYCTQDPGSCERSGEHDDAEEIDPHESGSEGPMMNYSYELPGFHGDEYRAASKIADLPLCLVVPESPRDTIAGLPALALTGGGMDLTWEIAEAFMRLGYLPPIAYCELPSMCGRGTLSNAGQYGGQNLSPRDRWIISGCRRAIEEQRQRTTNNLNYLERKLADL